MLGRRRHDFSIGIDRLVELSEAGLVHLTKAKLEPQDLVGSVCDFRFARQDVGKFRPTLRICEQSIESTDGS